MPILVMPSLFWNSEILNSWTLFLLKYILRLWTMDCLLYVQNSLRYQLWFLWKKADIKADIFYRRKNFSPLWWKHSSWFDSSTEDWGLVWGIPVTSLESLYIESISAHSLVLRALVMVLGCKEIQRDQSIGTWFCNMGFNVVFEVRKKGSPRCYKKFFCMIYAFYSVGSKEPIQRYPDLSHDAGAETSCCSEVTCGCQIQASTVADIVTICVALIVTICPIQLCWLVEWRICKSALLPQPPLS